MDSRTNIPKVEQLVEQYVEVLYRFAYRLTGSAADAEDLVQETFLIAHQKLHQLRDGTRALPWLLRIVRSCRSRQFHTPTFGERIPLEEIADARTDPRADAGILDEVDPERLLAILNQMPEEFREPLLLFYFEDLRYREIAEVLDCPIGTVMSRLARGKEYLRSKLVPQGCEDRH